MVNEKKGLEPIVVIENVTKRFGGLVAVDDVSLKVYPGERHSIIGSNGAGKTTLFNMISGELSVTSGKIYIKGIDVTDMKTYKRVPLGLARTFQITNLFPTLSVLENVILGLQGIKPSKFVMWKPLSSYREYYEEAENLLNQFDLWRLKDTLVKNLSYGDQRLMEVILGLASKPEILALDEPSSGLSSAETDRLIDVLNGLEKELTIILIEHDMKVAYDVTENMTVLADGVVVAEGTVEEVRNNERVKEIYLGKVATQQ
ncbi:MAG: ABC transporter ATP-binding protein [Bacillota bacterium]|nr:ABC transporter ATP-binding protein [Bacillota bacterium]